jgi:hypothetical protein
MGLLSHTYLTPGAPDPPVPDNFGAFTLCGNQTFFYMNNRPV